MKIFNLRFNYCLLLGDTHSLKTILTIIKNKLNIDNFDIIFLGDGGEGFGRPESDAFFLNKINNVCKNRNIFIYFIRGNHSNPDVWKRNYDFSNLFLVPDYSAATFPNNKSALLVGGGVSVDRSTRKVGVDYWPDEITIYQKTNKKFDFLFSHDAPDYFNHSTFSLKNSPYAPFLTDDPTLYQDCLTQRNVLGKIVKDIEPRFCCSGHFHCAVTEEKNGIKYRCLNIDELWEFDSEKF